MDRYDSVRFFFNFGVHLLNRIGFTTRHYLNQYDSVRERVPYISISDRIV